MLVYRKAQADPLPYGNAVFDAAHGFVKSADNAAKFIVDFGQTVQGDAHIADAYVLNASGNVAGDECAVRRKGGAQTFLRRIVGQGEEILAH